MDIVNDLAASGIYIDVRDVMKKSNEEARLNSYKVSVKAEDFEKPYNQKFGQ